MDIIRPLRAGLFVYECLRLLTLVIFLLTSPFEGSIGGPYSVYMSSNALFPIMALFMWIGYEEYRNYASLFIAGKVIAMVSFFVWEVFSFIEFAGSRNATGNLVFFGGSALLCLADTISVWVVWAIDNKYRNKYRRAIVPEGGGN